MAKLRRRQRQHDATRGATAARKAKPRAAEQGPLEAQQHALGNQAVQRLMDSRAVQAKLTVGEPNDAYEQEADRVASQVMGMAPPSPAEGTGTRSIQRLGNEVQRAEKKEADDKKKPEAKGTKEPPKKEGGKQEGSKDKKKDDDKAKRKPILDDEKKEEEPVQREAATEAEVPSVSPALEASLDAQGGGGEPLPESLRSFFEPRMGADLSQVRLHTDPQAAQAAAELEAQAFTRGRDVFFGAGFFEPESARGRWLLAHELTHTVQQTRGPGAPEREPQGDRLDPPFPIEVRPAAAPMVVARKDDDEEPSGTE
jgi:hypothetical protein